MARKFRMQEFMEKHQDEKHLVVLHPYPDPDAIALAFAHQQISARHNIQADIIYCGKISHIQNLALVKLLGIELKAFKSGIDLHQYQGAIFVDHQGTAVDEILQILQQAGVPLLLVVDHHEEQKVPKPCFCDLRKVGATSTIYARYLQQIPYRPAKGDKDQMALATALLHGILTDTAGFMRAGREDFQAAAYLSQFRDSDLLERIMNQARPK